MPTFSSQKDTTMEQLVTHVTNLVRKVDGIATLMIPDQINLNEHSIKVSLPGG